MTPMSPARLGRYEIQDELGRGGMAVVYRARDQRLGTGVALKVLPPLAAQDDLAVARFEREMRAAASVEHPALVRLLDAGIDGGTRWLAFELLGGGTLDAYVKKHGRLGWRQALAHGATVARALAALHGAGIVHRDVKPANVLLDAHGNAKLADFGLARTRAASDKLTASGDLSGTFEFLSPEQADGQPATEKSDLYGLGVLLYVVLAGVPPFEGEGFALMKRVMTEAPPPIRARAPEVPPAVAGLVERLLSKDPPARGTSAATVALELEALRAERSRAWASFALPAALLLGVAAGLAVPRRSSTPLPPQAVPPPPASAVAAVGTPALRQVGVIGSPARNEVSAVFGAAFCGETTAVVGCQDGTVAFWDLATATRTAFPHVHGHTTGVAALGSWAVSIGSGAAVDFWDVTHRRPLATWQLEKTHAVCVAADRAREVAYVGCTTGEVYTIAFRGGPPVPARIHRDKVNAMAVLRDGELVTVSDDGRLCVSLGDRIDFDQPFTSKMRAVATARDADVFAVGDDGGGVRVFAPQGGAWHQHSWHLHEGPVTAVALSHDGAIVLSAGAESGDVKVWNAATGEPVGVLAGHTGPVSSIQLSSDGHRALTGSVDTSIGVWDLASRRELGRGTRQRRGPISALAVSEDGVYGLAGGLDRVVEVFDTGTLEPVEPFAVRAPSAIRAAVFIPGARHALVMAGSGVVQRVEPGNPNVTTNAPQAPTRDVTPWCLAASGAHVFAANRVSLGEIT